MSDMTLEDFLQALQSPDADVRRNAAWRLGRFRDERVIAPLINALQDADPTVRARAVESLGTRREAHVVAPLMACLGDAEAQVRRMAVRSLGLVGHLSARDVLMGLLDDDDAMMRSQSAEALGVLAGVDECDSTELIPMIAPLVACLGDVDENVRYYASQALQAIGSPLVDEALLGALTADTHADTLRLLLELMGKLASPAFAQALTAYEHDADEVLAMTAQWALTRLHRGA